MAYTAVYPYYSDSYSRQFNLESEKNETNSQGVTIPGSSLTKKKEVFKKSTDSEIHNEKLCELLAPFSTNKEDDEETIGEKGVGLTFVIFQSNNFKITTIHENKKSTATIKNGRQWKNSTSTSLPQIENYNVSDSNEKSSTCIEVMNLGDIPIFELTFKQLEYVLRSKTAAGNTTAKNLGDRGAG